MNFRGNSFVTVSQLQMKASAWIVVKVTSASMPGGGSSWPKTTYIAAKAGIQIQVA